MNDKLNGMRTEIFVSYFSVLLLHTLCEMRIPWLRSEGRQFQIIAWQLPIYAAQVPYRYFCWWTLRL